MGNRSNGNGNGHKPPLENKPKANGNPNWVKGGASPNPGGRPKAAIRLRDKIQEHGDAIVGKLLEMAGLAVGEDGKPIAPVPIIADQQRALQILLDRGFGKPAQAITGADGAPLFPAQPTSPHEAAQRLQERGLPSGLPVN